MKPTPPCERFHHVCPVCGNDFLGRKDRRFCSHRCVMVAVAHEMGKKGAAATIASRRAAARAAEMEATCRRRRLAERDAAYEAAYPGLQSGVLRGRIAIGGRPSVVRDCDTGAIVRRYIAPTSEQ